MEIFRIENLTFKYPTADYPALSDLSMCISQGELVTICGTSGSGKTTLLRQLKPVLAPHGERSGSIQFHGKKLDALSAEEQARNIGFVLQNPSNQIVTDKVWHELAFGLENLGVDSNAIRLRVGEMANYFGIQNWFHRDVSQLSGGQRQLLNLASVMTLQPEVLILDEPTAQLDPIAAGDFLDTLRNINRDLGTTVIITEHRLEYVVPMSDRIIALENGELAADCDPRSIGRRLVNIGSTMIKAMPSSMQIEEQLRREVGEVAVASQEHEDAPVPINVREGRQWLDRALKDVDINIDKLPDNSLERGNVTLELKDIWFRYDRKDVDVLKGLSIKARAGELFAILGGNGSGKTTSMMVASGVYKAYRGRVKVGGRIAMLPQDPLAILTANTVRDEVNDDMNIAGLMGIERLLDSHPYDLSGGEQQRVALAKVLIMEPDVVILDEPTKGMDAYYKEQLASMIHELKQGGKTVIMVSHDVEFCGKYADRCALFFDGSIISEGSPKEFFAGNSFYTTAANRMARHIFSNAVTVDDVVEIVRANLTGQGGDSEPNGLGKPDKSNGLNEPNEPNKLNDSGDTNKPSAGKARNHIIMDIFMIVLSILTVIIGFKVFGNQRYFVVGTLIAIYSMVPLVYSFEKRKPQAREIVIIAVLIATAVVGRGAFFMVPNFKPILAIVIIAGISLGRESGFLVGAMSALISNFLFGQGPWTPWQMLAMAIVGYLAGAIFSRYSDSFNKYVLIVFGVVATVVIYGGIVDLWTILAMTSEPTWATAMAVYGAAIPFNAVHALATAIFLFLLAKPMAGKIQRVKVKYGIRA